ncbi:MAG TPA: hypothetical protein VIA62_03680 [Thermoanaerobaculia bacterium]|nr:hypothetical protein [Thermoanaerobaculia bacterium]
MLTRDDLAPRLRAILRDAVRGAFSPADFLDAADDQSLLDLAAHLYQERQALLSRIRSASPIRRGLRTGVGQLFHPVHSYRAEPAATGLPGELP